MLSTAAITSAKLPVLTSRATEVPGVLIVRAFDDFQSGLDATLTPCDCGLHNLETLTGSESHTFGNKLFCASNIILEI